MMILFFLLPFLRVQLRALCAFAVNLSQRPPSPR
jgi:hypothetical protein